MGSYDKMKSPFRAGGTRYLSRKMVEGNHAAEVILDRPRNSLYIAQGSWNVGYKPSAGTHDKSGVEDVYDDELDELVKALRKLGFPGYHRTREQGFDPHAHVITYGDPGMGSYARLQQKAYLLDRNGLGKDAKAGPDTEWAPYNRNVKFKVATDTDPIGDWKVKRSSMYSFSQATQQEKYRLKRREKGFSITTHLCTVKVGNTPFVVTDSGAFYKRSDLTFVRERKNRCA